MSCNYADGLTPYENKGVLGVPEIFDEEAELNRKCEELATLIEAAAHVVVHTGAGISTAAGIPDFRGPNGVWTLEEKGEKPTINVSFADAAPTKTHMALKALVDAGRVKYIISQNIDGLHLKSGLARKHISELHGNMFVENCSKCRRQYVRATPAPTVGQKPTGGLCKGGTNQRACRGGQLLDNILDWEHDLPDKDMDLAYSHSCLADLNICLGSTLQINPSGQLAIKNKKYGGKMVICNLQPTKYDKKSDLVINAYVDVVIEKVMKRLGVEIPEYTGDDDPTKDTAALALEWTIPGEQVKETEKLYNAKVKGTKKRKPFLLDWDTPPKKLATARPKKEKATTAAAAAAKPVPVAAVAAVKKEEAKVKEEEAVEDKNQATKTANDTASNSTAKVEAVAAGGDGGEVKTEAQA